MNCICCGKETSDYPFHVLQVQTLHVRDLKGEKRVQALGDFEDYCVCAACAEEKYRQSIQDTRFLIKSVLPYFVLTLLGPILAAAFWTDNGAFRLLGLGMLICGILGAFSTFQAAGKTKRQLLAQGKEQALRTCAWRCMVDHAPKKNDVNDITYIPVNEETISRKNGDLMILYDLLPEIAVQAHKRIHGEE